jgi:hypothetical protein
MKKMIRLLVLGATVAVLAWPIAASAATIVQDQCTEENKTAWYATFRETFKTDQQPKAYEAAKKYLTACSEDTQITQYLKKWVTAYEKEIRKVKLPQLLSEKKWAEAFQLGREILTDDPENVKVLMQLGYGGYLASSNKQANFNADALNYARKAIQMIESGKAPDDWQPFPNKDEALAFLTYYIGVTTLAQDPGAALPNLIKAAKLESTLKKSPLTYDRIATAYEAGPYAKQSADYKTKFQGKDETPESKLALENINQIVDRMIDAYARAVATAGSDPQYAAQKNEWNEALKTWYKYRHKDETGMNELVAGILAKPLPPEPTPLTSLPVSAPAATPASGTGAAGAGNGTTGTTAGATTGTATTTTANTQTATKPATTTTTPASSTPKPAGSKRPRRNHRGH